MTRERLLHWFYTAMLVIFIGTFHVIAGVNIAVKLAEKKAKVVAKEVVKAELKLYDSTVTKRNEMQYDTIIQGLNSIKHQMK